MTWDTFHRRGEILRNVLEHVETHRDGRLPMQLAGVREAFGDELTLLGTLQLRWHTRLAGIIETELGGEPVELSDAVVTAWCKAAAAMPGLRAVLDRYTAEPTSPEMAAALDRARAKDHTLLAAMAGQSAPGHSDAEDTGRALEARARRAYRPARPSTPGRRRAEAPPRPSLLSRVKAVLAA